MSNQIKDINDQLAKEQGEIAKINRDIQTQQTRIQQLVKVGNMREGRISLLREQLEAIKPKKEAKNEK